MAKALLATLPTPPTQLQLGVLVRRVQRQPGRGAAAAVTAAWQNGVYRRDFQAVTSVTLKAADDLVLTR